MVSARRAAERERKLEADRVAYDLYGEERVDVKCRRASCVRAAQGLSARSAERTTSRAFRAVRTPSMTERG